MSNHNAFDPEAGKAYYDRRRELSERILLAIAPHAVDAYARGVTNDNPRNATAAAFAHLAVAMADALERELQKPAQ